MTDFKAPQEIERKYIVRGHLWQSLPFIHVLEIRQGYLSVSEKSTVRVRVTAVDGKKTAYITIKSRRHGHGLGHDEFEYEIDVQEAEYMLENLRLHSVVAKTRHVACYMGAEDLVWEIDEFHGANDGLVLAELEVPSVDFQVTKPSWIRSEVPDDLMHHVSNFRLAEHPVRGWRPDVREVFGVRD